MLNRRSAILASVASIFPAAVSAGEYRTEQENPAQSISRDTRKSNPVEDTAANKAAPRTGPRAKPGKKSSRNNAKGKQKKATNRPSIVFVLLDDMRATDWDALPYAHSLGGTWYENYFTNNPQCGPSRTSLLTGMYSHNHGIMSNGMDNEETDLWKQFRAHRLEKLTLNVALQKAGYHTGLVGKFLNGYSDTAIPAGWDDWHATMAPKYYGPRLNDNGAVTRYPSTDYLTDVLKTHAVRFIETAPVDKPLFLYWASYAPHSPASPKSMYSGKFAGALAERTPAFNEADVSDKPAVVQQRISLPDSYFDQANERRLESLLSADLAVRAIVRALKRTGRYKKTYIFVMSDNGYLLGIHRLQEKGFPYDRAVRIPMLVHGPKFASKISRDLVSTVDVTATALALGKGTLRRCEGRNLLGATHRESVLLENGDAPGWSALRGPDWMYAEYGDGDREFYDYNTDPYELENALRDPSDELPAAYADLPDKLAAARDCRLGSCP